MPPKRSDEAKGAAEPPGYASMYIVVAALVGAIVGTLFGAVFDEAIGGRRILSVLAGLAAVAVDQVIRRNAATVFPALFPDSRTAATSPALLFVACVIALAGGLATHDLGLVFNVMAGPVLGGFSGLFAALMVAVLVVLREAERHRGR